ncbi:MAG: hypothetical protein R3C25_10075 [Hyphomonadaceae bacterium]
MRGALIGLCLLLLAPLALIAIAPATARAMFGVDISGWRQSSAQYATRIEDVRRCAALVRNSGDPRARAFRERSAACSLCAHLLAAVPDPEPAADASSAYRDAIMDRNRFQSDLRARLSRADENLSLAFAARERALDAFARGRINPVRTSIDFRASMACEDRT